MKQINLLALLAVLILLVEPSVVHAAEGWAHWWLPPNYSKHGGAIDRLFIWIFWITTVAFIGVQLVLVYFLIKYRFNPNKKKAVFSHGNRRLEMFWTLTPAIILAALALGSKKVWDDYRYSPILQDENRAKILVIGQQFKWNTVYPGPDGKVGRYLMFPKPTDTAWPDFESAARERARQKAIAEGKTPPAEKPYLFAGVRGPAFLPYEKAIKAINDFNESNPLGKDFSDPEGKDDIWEGALARQIVLPADRPIEVQLSSKDVIHDFFLPNFRVKLDAVPGMRGLISFQSEVTSRQKEEIKTFTLEDLSTKLDAPEIKAMLVEVDRSHPLARSRKNDTTKLIEWRYADPKKESNSLVRGGTSINKVTLDRLKAAGFTEITLYKPVNFELVCEELCGQGHYTMRGEVRFVTNDEYDALQFDKPFAGATTQPTTQPSAGIPVAALAK